MGVEFGILGDVEVRVEGHEVDGGHAIAARPFWFLGSHPARTSPFCRHPTRRHPPNQAGEDPVGVGAVSAGSVVRICS